MTDPKSNGSGPDWAQLLQQATPRTKTVRLCLRGDLLAALADAEAAAESPSLSGEASDVADLRRQVESASVEFVIKGLSGRRYEALQAEYRNSDGEIPDDQDEAFRERLVRECLISPVVAEDQPIADALTAGEFQRLWTSAIYATVEVDEVPLPKRG